MGIVSCNSISINMPVSLLYENHLSYSSTAKTYSITNTSRISVSIRSFTGIAKSQAAISLLKECEVIGK